MNGPRDYHTKWSKSEKDKYPVIYVWNLKKWYKWTYIQNRNRLTKNKAFMVTKRGVGKFKLSMGLTGTTSIYIIIYRNYCILYIGII